MAEAFLAEAVRTPVGRRGGGLSGAHPADLGAHVITGPAGPHRRGPAGRGRRGVRLRGHHRPAGRRHRQDRLAGGRPARGGARRHRGPAVRLVPAGGALRGPGGAQRHRRPGGGRRGAEHEPDPDRGRDAGRAGLRVRRPVRRVGGLAGPVRRAGDLPVPRRRHDRGQVGDQPRRDGSVRAGQPRAGDPGRGRGAPSRPRSCPTAGWPPTSARAGTPRRRRWPRWRRCARAG